MSSGVMAQLVCFLTQSVRLEVRWHKVRCFTVGTAAVGWESRICETAVAGYVRATFLFGNQELLWVTLVKIFSIW